jgi:hypothetical protein
MIHSSVGIPVTNEFVNHTSSFEHRWTLTNWRKLLRNVPLIFTTRVDVNHQHHGEPNDDVQNGGLPFACRIPVNMIPTSIERFMRAGMKVRDILEPVLQVTSKVFGILRYQGEL